MTHQNSKNVEQKAIKMFLPLSGCAFRLATCRRSTLKMASLSRPCVAARVRSCARILTNRWRSRDFDMKTCMRCSNALYREKNELTNVTGTHINTRTHANTRSDSPSTQQLSSLPLHPAASAKAGTRSRHDRGSLSCARGVR